MSEANIWKQLLSERKKVSFLSNEPFLLIFNHRAARASKQSGQKHIWGSLKLAGEH